jgi:hypothetical protein
MTKLQTIAALAITVATIGLTAPALACGPSSVAYQGEGYGNEFSLDTRGSGNQVGVVHNRNFNSTDVSIDGDCNTLVEGQRVNSSSTSTIRGDGNQSANMLKNASADLDVRGDDNTTLVNAKNANIRIQISGSGSTVSVKSR